MTGAWTFEDLDRLTLEAIEAGDEALLARIWASDNFEPGLRAEPFGITKMILRTKEEIAENRARVLAIFAERAAIKARWAAQAA
jgi:hypothetical protein